MKAHLLAVWRRGRAIGGFNMIEVTLAVAIVALGLVAILGLLPVGIDASRRVADDTSLSTLVGDMLNWRRVTPFDKPTWFPGGNFSLADLPRPKTLIEEFDVNGFTATDPIFTNTASPFYNTFNPYYRVIYEVRDNPQFPGAADFAQLCITIEWPLIKTGTLAPNANKRIFISNYARHQ
ncbi:MAG: hypothetical protein N3A53_05580 [Verrucomicrobiae bacterium]|nr:hypothetical protein [Verrucomicrobiae bacterium]